MNTILWISTALCGFCSLNIGQQTVDETPSVDPPSTARQIINFRLTPQNNIVVRATLNEMDDCDLMFHTAVESVSLISTSTPKLKSVEFTQKGNTISWGGQRETRLSPQNSIRIGGRTWTGIAITEDRHSGIGTDGKFGWGLFDKQIVEIDFDQRQLKTHSRLPDVNGYTVFRTEYDRGGMTIECGVEVGSKKIKNRFLVHSGFSGTALFDDEFTSTHKLHSRWESSAGRSLKDSLGNTISTSRVLVPSMSFGSTELENIPAELFPGDIGSQKISVIGAGLLKRFNVIIDAERQHIYLKPNEYFATVFPKTDD